MPLLFNPLSSQAARPRLPRVRGRGQARLPRGGGGAGQRRGAQSDGQGSARAGGGEWGMREVLVDVYLWFDL